MDTDEERVSLSYNLLWSLWKARCRLIFENKRSDPGTILEAAIKGHGDYSSTQILEESHNPEDSTQELSNHTWIPPPSNIIKINVDGATRETKLAAAAVGRDNNGRFICGATRNYAKGRFQKSSAEEAEANAILLGLDMAKNGNLEEIIVECDSITVVNTVNNPMMHGSWRIKVIYQEIRELILKFKSCVV